MNPLSIRPFKGTLPESGRDVYIDPLATVVGNVRLGDQVSIWPYACLRGDVNQIEIGANTNVQDAAVLHVTHDGPYSPGGFALKIGENVTIGHRATLHGCVIESYCLIGINAVVLDGAHIEPYVLLGAGSLVPPGKRLKSGYLYVGSPAKPLRPLSDKEKQSLEYSAEHYVRLKNQYLNE